MLNQLFTVPISRGVSLPRFMEGTRWMVARPLLWCFWRRSTVSENVSTIRPDRNDEINQHPGALARVLVKIKSRPWCLLRDSVLCYSFSRQTRLKWSRVRSTVKLNQLNRGVRVGSSIGRFSYEPSYRWSSPSFRYGTNGHPRGLTRSPAPRWNPAR